MCKLVVRDRTPLAGARRTLAFRVRFKDQRRESTRRERTGETQTHSNERERETQRQRQRQADRDGDTDKEAE